MHLGAQVAQPYTPVTRRVPSDEFGQNIGQQGIRVVQEADAGGSAEIGMSEDLSGRSNIGIRCSRPTA
jgi:hypothetical protein